MKRACRRHRHRRWYALLTRCWPDGIAGRVAVVLAAGLLAAYAAGVLFYLHQREGAAARSFALSVADRVAAATELMQATPAEARATLLRALNSPLLRVSLSKETPAPTAAVAATDEIEQLVRQRLQNLGNWPLSVDLLRFHDNPPSGGEQPGKLLPSFRKIVIATGLADGDWLLVTAPVDIPALRWRGRGGFGFLLTSAGIILLGFWAAHRMTRPLVRFAEAADRFGVDVGAPPLPEQGSRELRQAARAFNRMQDRLRRLIEDRTRVLAAISHDLRTSLTRLKLRADFIDDPEQQRKALSDIEDMKTMLEATLSFARDDAREEARTPLDLAVLLQSLCEDRADAGKNVVYHGPDRATFNGRPVALRRVFGNLIDNAVSYGGEARVALTASTHGVEVTIEDRGPGIPAAQYEQVFAPFFRLETSRSRETGGTGLGLTIARSAVRRHGGDIVLENRPAGGLRVQVILPSYQPATSGADQTR